MDSIKAQKLQAMRNYKKAQLVYNLLVYSLAAFLSSLFYLYLFWFPSMRQCLFDFLPNVYSFFLSPKFLFLLGNIIVIILVGESRLRGSCSSPATEIYDEYVERSRNLRRQSVNVVECDKKKDRSSSEMDKNEKTRIRRHASLNNIRSCLDVKKKELAGGRSLRRPRSVVERKKDGCVLEIQENEKTTVATQDDEGKRKEKIGKSLTMPQCVGRLEVVQYENEKITTMATPSDYEEKRKETVLSQSLKRPQSLGRLDMHEIKTNGDDEQNKISLEEKRNEMEQSMDELNRRVEEFIARVNRQRMLEARELD